MKTRFLVHVLVILASLIGLASLPLPAQAQAPAGTTVTFDPGTHTIHIVGHIEILDKGADDLEAIKTANTIQEEINTVWQDSKNRHAYCGYDVIFEAQVRPQQGSGTPGWHPISLVRYPHGRFFRSYVMSDSLVYSTDVGGVWDANDLMDTERHTAAHEAGHLFGARDGYADDADGQSHANPGRENTVMDLGTYVDDQAFEEIMERVRSSLPQGTLPECSEGTVTITGHGYGCVLDSPGSSCTGSGDVLNTDLPKPNSKFQVSFDRSGHNILGGSAQVTANWAQDYVGFATCQWILHVGGVAEFAGQASPGPFTGNVTFVGTTVTPGEATVTPFDCRTGIPLLLPGTERLNPDTLVLESFDPQLPNGPCRLGWLEQMQRRSMFTAFNYTCTYTWARR